ncbi:MAG: low molecular weight phosphatase family protein [Propioniciclava sp.]|nr:low molecular weight phosphatase family protein [Propioniciclava sp.]
MSTDRPTVLFVCVSNGGKSQMAEALMRAHVGDSASIHSAGTAPKGNINAESAASVARAGASMDAATSKPIDPDLLRTADRVIVLGRDAQVEPVGGMTATIERWDTDEPSLRGIEGDERMDLIRDDIQNRVEALADELGLARPQAGA